MGRYCIFLKRFMANIKILQKHLYLRIEDKQFVMFPLLFE